MTQLRHGDVPRRHRAAGREASLATRQAHAGVVNVDRSLQCFGRRDDRRRAVQGDHVAVSGEIMNSDSKWLCIADGNVSARFVDIAAA